MAKSIVIYCGDDSAPFALLAGQLYVVRLLRNLRRWHLSVIHHQMLRPKTYFWAMWLSVRRVSVQASENLVSTSSIVVAGTRQNRYLVPMRRNLRWLNGLECGDPRDVIYATLSLVDWNNRPRVQPDYSKSCVQLALDVLASPAGEEDEIGSKQLVRRLVRHLQLHEQVAEIEMRVASLSHTIPCPPAPVSEARRAPFFFRVQGFVLSSGNTGSELGVFCRAKNNKTSYFNPVLSTTKMQEGDYVLLSALAVFGTMIVARGKAKAEIFELTGYTKFAQSLLFDDVQPELFDLHFDCEDLLMREVLETAVFNLSRSGSDIQIYGSESLEKLLSRRVCRYEGSSYAVRLPSATFKADKTDGAVRV